MELSSVVASNAQRSILLVEDEPIIAMAEANQLRSAGYYVVTARSGERAIEIVEAGEDPVDLVLMDINLGQGMDGTEAALRIQSLLDLPLVFLSSHTEQEIVKKTELITNYGYVVKNSSFTVLDASIKMAFKLFDAHRSIRAQKMEMEAAYEEMQVANEELLHTQQELVDHARALNESEETFRSLFEKGPIGIAYHRMVYDEAGKSVDYIILDANPSYEEMTGISSPAGRRVTEIFPGIERDPFDWIGTYGEVARAGKELRFRQHFEFNDRWYEIVVYRNKPDHFVTVFFEITEQKRAEDALSESEAKFRRLVSDMHVGVLLQGPTADINLSNPQALELLGLSDDQLLGRTSFDPSWNVIHVDGSPFPGSEHPVPVAIATRRPVRNAVMGVYRPVNGDRVWLSVDAVPQLAADGSVSQVVCTFIDITERIRAEESVGRLLKEKELVLKEAHHRIKNNMNALGSLFRLKSDSQSDEVVSAALGDAVNRVSSMMVLYDKLYRSGAEGYLAVKEFLPDLIERIVGNFPKKIPIQIETSFDDIVIGAERLSSIGIIVNELITNSMKHAFAGRAAGRIKVTAAKAGGRVRLVYEDDGVGMPGARVDEEPKGFGMRLIAMLVEQIGGTLAVESEGGARFDIEFGA